MLENCEQISSTSSSPISVMSYSSSHSSPTLNHHNNPASISSMNNSNANFASLKSFPSDNQKPTDYIKGASFLNHNYHSVHNSLPTFPFVPSTMCSPINNVYANNNLYNFSSLLNNPQLTKQMFFGNHLSQTLHPSTLNNSFLFSNPYFTPKQLTNSLTGLTSTLNPFGLCPESIAQLQAAQQHHQSPTRHQSSFHQTQHEENHIEHNETMKKENTNCISQSWRSQRSPSEPLTCPLCLMSLDGIDKNKHFYEEVHKVETLRKLNDWEIKEANKTTTTSNENKKLPYSRHETYQRVRQNRQLRFNAMLKITKRIEFEQHLRSQTVTSVTGNPLWNVQLNLAQTQCQNKALPNESHKRNDVSDDEDADADVDGDEDDDGNHNENQSKRRKFEKNFIQNDEDHEMQLENSKNQTEPVTSMSQAERSSSTPTDGQEVRSPSSEILENGLNQSNSTDGHVNSENSIETVETLKNKMLKLENKENHNEKHCVVCLNLYQTPLVSLGCWHVHCKMCWINELESTQKCPQCNKETSLKDLKPLLL